MAVTENQIRYAKCDTVKMNNLFMNDIKCY